MDKQYVYYGVIAGGVLVMVAVAVFSLLGESEEPLDPPAVVERRLTTGETKDTKIKAARDLVRHGTRARMEIRRAVQQHEQYEPEVLAPLLQATMKTRDYRSMPELLELLEHEDPIVRGRAGAAVKKILGADLGFRAYDPPDKRAETIAKIRADYEVALPRMREFYGHQEP